MRFSLLVMAAPDSPAALTALHTAQNLINHPEHSLYRLFFYGDGVLLANALAWRGDGKRAGAAQQWQAFVRDHEVDASVCVGAAQRRGVCDDKLASPRQCHGNLAAGFTLAGLGQWADAQRQSERVIQFG